MAAAGKVAPATAEMAAAATADVAAAATAEVAAAAAAAAAATTATTATTMATAAEAVVRVAQRRRTCHRDTQQQGTQRPCKRSCAQCVHSRHLSTFRGFIHVELDSRFTGPFKPVSIKTQSPRAALTLCQNEVGTLRSQGLSHRT